MVSIVPFAPAVIMHRVHCHQPCSYRISFPDGIYTKCVDSPYPPIQDPRFALTRAKSKLAPKFSINHTFDQDHPDPSYRGRRHTLLLAES